MAKEFDTIFGRPDSDDTPSETLLLRIRERVQTTPASTIRPLIRVVIAIAAVVLLSAGVLVMASEIVCGRLAVGLGVGTGSTRELLLALALLAGLALMSTFVAVRRGPTGVAPFQWRVAFVGRRSERLPPPGGPHRLHVLSIRDLQHILVGHVLPIVVFMLAGSIAGPRVLRP